MLSTGGARRCPIVANSGRYDVPPVVFRQWGYRGGGGYDMTKRGCTIQESRVRRQFGGE